MIPCTLTIFFFQVKFETCFLTKFRKVRGRSMRMIKSGGIIVVSETINTNSFVLFCRFAAQFRQVPSQRQSVRNHRWQHDPDVSTGSCTLSHVRRDRVVQGRIYHESRLVESAGICIVIMKVIFAIK